MSDPFMPIDLRQINTGQPGAGTKRADQSSENVSSKDDSGSEKAVTQQDSVELSGKAQLVKSLISEMSSQPEVNESRVAELRASIASGEFSVSADKIASKMLALDDGLRKLS